MGRQGAAGAPGIIGARRSARPVIHLDTSFLVRALARGSREDRRLRTWLRGGTSLAISAIAWAEFLCGPLEAEELERIVPEPCPSLRRTPPSPPS
ncbi:MAG TPA: PIN domain-containing protein, partial [Candidatus Limnocylindria bacterium]|nr:PIN domain-containing protein [Candidatus Limnocylindria bacterium]